MNRNGKNIEVSILIIKRKDPKGDKQFIARCMEYDMAEQGKTIAEAQQNIYKMLIKQIMLDLHNGTVTFFQFEKAPEDLQKLFKSAKPLKNTLPPPPINPEKIKHFPTLEIKEWRFFELKHPVV